MLEDGTYCAIGRVAVEASSLQYTAAICAALGLGEGEEWVRQVLAKPGSHVQEALRKLAKLIGDKDEALRKDVEQYADDIAAALEDRNRVLHSVSMFSSDGRTLEEWAWHPRTDVERPIDHDELRDIEQRLGGLAGRGGVVLSWDIKRWRDEERRPDAS